MYKSINGLAPKYLTNKFIQRSDVNPYNLAILRISLLFPCRVQTILKIVLVIVVQLCGTAYPLRLGKQVL